MNFINLLSILESKNNLSDELFKKYLEYLDISLEDNEIEDLLKLIKKIVGECQISNIFDGYYIGYRIPQISKEFDLLRITENSIFNIELKCGASKESIKKQLIKNKYYLESLGKEKIYNITYQSSEDKLYILDKNNDLHDLEVKDLQKVLSIDDPQQVDLNLLFDPSEFLVSPFNNTEKFVNNEYFLTNHQEKIKNEVIEIILENQYSFCAISGKAGTGKTLLVYDIAKEIELNKKKVLIVHCGNLNKGQIKLLNEHGFNLIPIKSFTSEKIAENYDLIVFDEAQRIHAKQLKLILENKKESNYLFSYDKTQILGSKDGRYGSDMAGDLFENKIKKHFKLSENIRTNEEVASFIRRFINKKDNKSKRLYKNISIQYFKNNDNVEGYIESLVENGWIYIGYTPKRHGWSAVYETYNITSKFFQSAHAVIGQEFDNVVVIVGEKFVYKETGALTHHINGPYMPDKMLFQAITRVRKKLKIIIVNNPEILERCIEILNPPKQNY